MRTNRNWRYRRRLRARLLDRYGGRCQACGTDERLEFAHVAPTPLSGVAGSRGSYRRLNDVRQHPQAYRLLCVDCHAALDGRGGRERRA